MAKEKTRIDRAKDHLQEALDLLIEEVNTGNVSIPLADAVDMTAQAINYL